MENLESFFIRYGEALSNGDLQGISGCYAVPSLVLSDDATIPIAERKEIEAAFDGAAEQYRSQGMVSARPAIVRSGSLTGKLISADVRWDYLDEEGNSVQQDAYRYVMRQDEEAGTQICVVISTSEG